MEREEMAFAFSKIANKLFKPQMAPPVKPQLQQQDAISATKDMKMKGATPSEYRREVTSRRTGTLGRHRQTPPAVS